MSSLEKYILLIFYPVQFFGGKVGISILPVLEYRYGHLVLYMYGYVHVYAVDIHGSVCTYTGTQCTRSLGGTYNIAILIPPV